MPDAGAPSTTGKRWGEPPPGSSIVGHMMWLTISAVGGIGTIGTVMHTQESANLGMWLIAAVSMTIGLATLAYAYFRPLANVPADRVPDAMTRVEEGRGGVKKDPAALVPAANPPATVQTKVS